MSDPYRAPPRPSWPCPRCEVGLAGSEQAGIRFDMCSRCTGIFAPHDIMRGAIDAPGVIDALRASLPRAPSPFAEGGRMYIKCPVCETLMNRKQFATGAHVVIDVCKPHGTWFDAGELPRVLDFMAAGGLERARARDAEREKEGERRERARRLSEQLEQPRVTGFRSHDKDLFDWLKDILWHL